MHCPTFTGDTSGWARTPGVTDCRRAARSDRSGMLPQFIDENPRVLAVVYGDRDQLHASLLKSPLERRHQPLGGLDPGTARVMSARERDEIRVSERHAEMSPASSGSCRRRRPEG